ncbi:MAG: hypothetical protein ABI980_12115 [Nitrospirota bacterium]
MPTTTVTMKDEKAILSDVVNAFSLVIVEMCRVLWEQQKIEPQEFVDKLTQAVDEMHDDPNKAAGIQP